MQRFVRVALAVAFAAFCPALPTVARAAPVFFTSTGSMPFRASIPTRSVERVGATRAYTVVNLSALIGVSPINFIPTALNDAGVIVGYDSETNRTHGNFGASYLILPNGSFGALDNTGSKPAYFIPDAISDTGQSITGNYLQFDLRHQTEFTGPVTWSYSGTRSHQFYRQLKAPAIVALASGNVPVGGAYYFGYTTFSATPFKTAGCKISDFSATAINDSGEIVGVGGGHAVTDTLTGCPVPVAGLPVIAHTASSPDAINSRGDLLISLTGSAVSAFGRRYVDVKGKLTQVALPATYSASAFYVDAIALGNTGAVVGNVMQQAPPFAIVAPFLYQNGSSIDINTLLPAKSGWRLLTAVAVNASGEIIGTGYFDGVLQGYALKP